MIINRYNFIKKTPLIYSKRLSSKYGCNVYLKREDLQTTRSFKIRGALNKIENLVNKIGNNINIVSTSAGNHAQGVCYVSNYFNIKPTIFIPEITPLQKVNKIKKYDANIIKKGKTFDTSLEYSQYYIKNKKNTYFIHPFDDELIIEGQGTILNEIYNEVIPDYICCSVGGGGLLSGLLTRMNNLNNEISFLNSIASYYIHPEFKTKFIGVEPYYSCSMYNSIKNNKITEIKNQCNYIDGASVKKVGNKTFDIINNNINNIEYMIKIKNEEVCNDLVELYQEIKLSVVL